MSAKPNLRVVTGELPSDVWVHISAVHDEGHAVVLEEKS
jgi:cold shock CspA family protein